MSEWTPRHVDHDPSAPPLLVEHLAVRQDGYEALSDVSFQLEKGQRVAIVGPNGAGKTTLLRILAGTLAPTSGRVQIFGGGPQGHICIAYVPQRSQVDWSFPVTVAEVVMMGRIRQLGVLRWPRRPDWELVGRALERVGMGDLRDRQIGALSGGQQQRVFLAQALAQQAEIILLDEPLTGLDMPSQTAIFDILENLRRDSVTVLVATHDLNLAAERFDRVMLLHRRLIAFGPPSQVLTRPHLLQAYGGHVHLLPEGEGMMVLTDTCCEGEEARHE
jgi:manganese/iron transport system ATP-binding protein